MYPVSLRGTPSITVGTFVAINEPTLMCYYEPKSIDDSDVLSFHLFLFWDCVSLGSSWLRQVLGFPGD